MRYVVVAAGWAWGLFALVEASGASSGWLLPMILFLGGGFIAIAWLSYSSMVPEIFKTPGIRWHWLSVTIIGAIGGFLSVTHLLRGDPAHPKHPFKLWWWLCDCF